MTAFPTKALNPQCKPIVCALDTGRRRRKTYVSYLGTLRHRAIQCSIEGEWLAMLWCLMCLKLRHFYSLCLRNWFSRVGTMRRLCNSPNMILSLWHSHICCTVMPSGLMSHARWFRLKSSALTKRLLLYYHSIRKLFVICRPARSTIGVLEWIFTLP